MAVQLPGCREIHEDPPPPSPPPTRTPADMVSTLSKAREGKCQWGWAGKYDEMESNFQPVTWASLKLTKSQQATEKQENHSTVPLSQWS